MPSLELKIPTPLVAAVVAGAMVAAAVWLPPVLEVPYGVRLGGALVLVGAGACFDLAGLRAFRKAHTTINPLRPDRAAAVVTTGVYRVTRNPMYLWLVLILLGLALYLASPWAVLGPPVFVAYITRYQFVDRSSFITFY